MPVSESNTKKNNKQGTADKIRNAAVKAEKILSLAAAGVVIAAALRDKIIPELKKRKEEE